MPVFPLQLTQESDTQLLSNAHPSLTQLKDILTSANLYSYKQSIQDIQSQKRFGYELLVRGPIDSPLHRADLLFDLATAHNYRDELEKASLSKHLSNICANETSDTFTVNLSPNLLFNLCILEILTHFPHPEKLKLELTEHLPVKNWQPVLLKMETLRQCGYEFWLDDVGCGHFDLDLIDTVQPEVVKLCMTLMNRLGNDDAFLQEFKTVVGKVHRYGGKVLVEGIETKAQLDLITALGVDYGQGYFFDKPAPM